MSDAHARGFDDWQRPNTRLHLTPLRVDEIGAILAAGFCSTDFSFY